MIILINFTSEKPSNYTVKWTYSTKGKGDCNQDTNRDHFHFLHRTNRWIKELRSRGKSLLLTTKRFFLFKLVLRTEVVRKLTDFFQAKGGCKCLTGLAPWQTTEHHILTTWRKDAPTVNFNHVFRYRCDDLHMCT